MKCIPTLTKPKASRKPKENRKFARPKKFTKARNVKKAEKSKKKGQRDIVMVDSADEDATGWRIDMGEGDVVMFDFVVALEEITRLMKEVSISGWRWCCKGLVDGIYPSI